MWWLDYFLSPVCTNDFYYYLIWLHASYGQTLFVYACRRFVGYVGIPTYLCNLGASC
uniref:Uncharacterized protein n=1 Tax=Kuenenia stuttgartiensis TaxID=174633 RepID=Q1Q4S8_KUEST|nr:unknown protein [Candidatus Kuenenia stuttgartiensis]